MLSKTILSKKFVINADLPTHSMLPKLPSNNLERLRNDSEERKKLKLLYAANSSLINISDPIKLSKKHLKENILKAYQSMAQGLVVPPQDLPGNLGKSKSPSKHKLSVR